MLIFAVAKYIRTDKDQVSAYHNVKWRFDDETLCLVPIDGVVPPLPVVGTELQSELPYFPNPPPTHTLGSSATLSPKSAVQSVDFCMRIVTKPGGKHTSYYELLQVSTQVQSSMGACPNTLDAVEDWRRYYPELEKKLLDPSSEGCDNVYLESNIALLRERPRDNMAVEIRFNINILCHLDCQRWCLRSTFYENGGKLQSQLPIQPINSRRLSPTTTRLFEFPLHGPWWVVRFRNADSQRQRAKRKGEAKIEQAGHVGWSVQSAPFI